MSCHMKRATTSSGKASCVVADNIDEKDNRMDDKEFEFECKWAQTTDCLDQECVARSHLQALTAEDVVNLTIKSNAHVLMELMVCTLVDVQKRKYNSREECVKTPFPCLLRRVIVEIILQRKTYSLPARHTDVIFQLGRWVDALAQQVTWCQALITFGTMLEYFRIIDIVEQLWLVNRVR